MKVTLETIRGLIKEVLEEQPGLGRAVARTGHQVDTPAKAAGRGTKWRQIGSVEPPGSGITGTEQYGKPTKMGPWSEEDELAVGRALCEKGLNLSNADALQRTASGLGVTLEDFLTHVQGSTIDSNLTTGTGDAAARLLNRAKRKGWVTDLPPGADCNLM